MRNNTSSRVESRRPLRQRPCPGMEQQSPETFSEQSETSSPSSRSSSSSSRSASTDHPDYALQPTNPGYDVGAFSMSMKVNNNGRPYSPTRASLRSSATPTQTYASPSRAKTHRSSATATRNYSPPRSDRRSTAVTPTHLPSSRQDYSANMSTGDKRHPKPSPKKQPDGGQRFPATVATPTVPYYPAKSPYAQQSCPHKHRSLCDIPRRFQVVLLLLVVVLLIIFYFALLGMVIENNKLEEINFKLLQAIKEERDNSK